MQHVKWLKTVTLLALFGAVFASGYVVRASRHAPPATPAAAGGRRILYYRDPMHPAYTSDKPGVAPDCGMPLEPVYASDQPAPAMPPMPGMPDMPAAPDARGEMPPPEMPPGAIRISPERQQTIGVKFATVESGKASRAIRTVGKVTFDETRVAHVHTRVDGWIDKVFVDFTGDVVKAGEPMLTIYSPEMLASQQELLLARRARDLMHTNPLASAAEHGDSLFEAAKRRLQLWDLGDEQIEQVLRTGEPIRTITVRAPASGFVTARNAFPNQKVTPDSDLYTITDLSRVWIVADVFESDVTSIKLGDAAYVAFAKNAAPPLAARVNYIQPQVDPTTRTVQVRLDAVNPGMRMKPDMYVDVEFGVAVASELTIPAQAVLDSGDRQTVFVDLGDGYLEPRRVVVGERFGDRVTVTQGLKAGERVVSSGTFLIDSESQLKPATDKMGAPAEHRHD